MTSSVMLCRVALVITDIKEGRIAFNRVGKISGLGTNVHSSLIISTLMMETIRSSETSVLRTRPHGVISQNTAFFIG
jgi:hypothetical protein